MTGLFVAIGHEPNSALLKGQLDLEENGYVRTVGRSTRTSVEGCSPAGTCRTTSTARRSPRPDPAAWRRSTPSTGSRNAANSPATAESAAGTEPLPMALHVGDKENA